MTPTNPITEARGLALSEELYEHYPAMSAQNHADEVRKYAARVVAPAMITIETQAAEIERIVRQRDVAEKNFAMCKESNQHNYNIRCQREAEINSLTAQVAGLMAKLAKAEEAYGILWRMDELEISHVRPDDMGVVKSASLLKNLIRKATQFTKGEEG